MRVSVLVPVYNEEEFAGVLLERVLAAPLPGNCTLEVIVVDDGSTDASFEVITRMAEEHSGVITVIRHPGNQGKGASIRTAIEHATGDIGLIQDADLEYDPAEYPKLLQPLVEGRADAVFGSRFVFAGERRVLYYWHSVANKLLTTLCNLAADTNLTDIETGYKAFRLSLVKSIPLRSNRFGIEPELTIKLAQRGSRIYEVPVSYHGRTYAEGKKIGFLDAVWAGFTILRFGFSRDIYIDHDKTILDSLADTRRFNRWMADVIAPYVGQRVLEIGAGIGNLTQCLSPKRHRYIAIDIDAEHLARLRTRFLYRKNVQTKLGNLLCAEDLREYAQSMDTVVCLNVLEHVEDDAAALRNIHDTLVPNGKAILLVPQGPSLFGTLDETLGHCRRYTEEELKAKMEAAGFRIECVLGFNRITRPGWYWNGRILRRRTFGRAQLWIFDRLVWLWRRIDEKLPWPPISIIAIGVRARDTL
ncbi:MAG TPA: bifunctional glycosyltransferase/class I SAM-dependent methyltransferase [Bryobacteraceae bacterium]|nr:bifunctional glycosyltransferase/class I SAM-dependent methyltransferase [Bryobacteraceae bacterium]